MLQISNFYLNSQCRKWKHERSGAKIAMPKSPVPGERAFLI